MIALSRPMAAWSLPRHVWPARMDLARPGSGGNREQTAPGRPRRKSFALLHSVTALRVRAGFGPALP
jgi:hypothetical protein